MDIEFTYKIDGNEGTTNYTDVTITPNEDFTKVTLVFPQITTDYVNLYNNMKNSPTDLKIKFVAFGANTEYLNLKIKHAVYRKILNTDFGELYDLTIVLEKY